MGERSAIERKWIRIDDVGLSKTGKTRVWAVSAKDGNALLGRIAWFGRWRTYAFFPHTETVYEPTCLRDIAEFVAAQMDARKVNRGR